MPIKPEMEIYGTMAIPASADLVIGQLDGDEELATPLDDDELAALVARREAE
jgi:hypothetical protein